MYQIKVGDKKSQILKYIILFVLVVVGLCGVNYFFEKYYLIWPVKFQNPIRIRGDIYPIEIKEVELDRMIDEEIKKIPTPSVTKCPTIEVPRKKVSYTSHSKKPFYSKILAWLKSNYTNWEAMAEIIGRESGFDPYAINEKSGACGLTQALPCGKMNCRLGDWECQLKWQKGYIGKRYGTASQALAFHDINGWY